jgi:tRNA(Ile)-lysidine synthase
MVRRVLRLWLVSAGVAPEWIGFDAVGRLEGLVAQRKGTGSVDVGGGWVVRRAYRRLTVGRDSKEAGAGTRYRAAVRVPGEALLPEAGLRVVTWFDAGVVKERGRGPGRLPARASISARAVGRRKLFVRSRVPGDRMRPLGLGGSKKIQDIFVDAKVPDSLRCRAPIVECAGRIVWVPGYRVAEGWDVRDPSARALQILVEWL